MTFDQFAAKLELVQSGATMALDALATTKHMELAFDDASIDREATMLLKKSLHAMRQMIQDTDFNDLYDDDEEED